MSTIIMITLAIGIIFWRPPFRISQILWKMISAILVIIVLSSLLILVTATATAKKEISPTATNQTDVQVLN